MVNMPLPHVLVVSVSNPPILATATGDVSRRAGSMDLVKSC